MLSGDVEPEMIEELCERSYRLVVSKLKKAEREAILLLLG